MKLHKYTIAALAGIAVALTGCDSFLDDQPRGNAIAETTDNYNGMFNTTDFMNMAVEDYTMLLNDDILFTEENISDAPTTMDKFDVRSLDRALRFQHDVYDISENCNIWESCYNKIYVYNVIANGVMSSSGGTEAQKKALQAEARVSRAYMHFLLAQMFSKPYDESYAETELTIPIVTEANSMATDFRRATMKEFYQFITTEMEEACPQLEDRQEHNMRVYMTAGYALLGKVYWMIGQYDKALPHLRKAFERMQKDPTMHLIDFAALQEKYGYRELTLMELNDEGGSGEGYMMPYAFANPEIFWVRNNPFYMGTFYLMYYGTITYHLDPRTYALFDEADLRRNLILTKNESGEPYPYPIGCIREAITNYGVDMPEIYLALAECEARVGTESEARKVVEEFLKCRMKPGHETLPASIDSKDKLIKFILDEEHREFMGSIRRFHSIRRLWNDPYFADQKPVKHTVAGQDYTMTEESLYLAIPETVLKWNESWREE